MIEEHRAQLGKQFTKPLKDGLFEIRVKSNEGVGRVLFCYAMRYRIIILHSFIKKTQKTPQKELEIALRRMKEVKI